jgi:dihydrofolate reductase
MNITIVMVSSLDGKITQGDDPDVSSWTSSEDKTLFASLKEQATLLIMGRQTYEVAKPYMKLSASTLRVVMTHTPEQYRDDAIPGQLEFTNQSPKELVTSLEQRGFQDALLLGGGQTNGVFLDEGLVSQFRLTLEPVVLGGGKELARVTKNHTLRLISMEQLNEKGSMHILYEVLS